MTILFWLLFSLMGGLAILEFIELMLMVTKWNVGTLVITKDEDKDTYRFEMNDIKELETMKFCTLKIKVKS